jgi:hypothetical protein
MPYPRKSVKLGVEGDGTPSLTIREFGSKGGTEVVCAPRHLESHFLEVVGEDFVSMHFLVTELGVTPDLYTLVNTE